MNNNIDDIYNVDTYSEKELFDILDVFNPTDRELEAKILSFIDKYSNSTNIDNIKLHTFFVDIYKHFFNVDEDEDEDDVEGFTNINNSNDNNIIKTNINTNQNLQLTSPLTYAKGKLNPILKQTYQRIITIDSQYRDSKNSLSTQFTLNFSETLKDVVSLKLYAVQIPYTWYTINKSYGSNFIYIKGNSPGIDNGNHDISINIMPGNYSLTTVSNVSNDTNNSISTAIQNAIKKLPNIYTDISFGTTNLSYDINQCKSTFNIDIQKQYNESAYYLNFPGEFHSPYPPDIASNSYRTKYLSTYLGFNSSIYSTCSVYSVRTLPELKSDVSKYAFETSNNTIQIIQYSNNNTSSYIPGICYETIKIAFPITDPSNVYKLTQYDIYNTVNDIISSHPKLNRPGFEGIDSFVKSIDISGIDISGNKVANYGNYYFQWQIKLNRYKVQNIPEYKTVLIVPNDSSIWIGSGSCFGFKNTTNEINNLVSETYVPYSNYDVSGIYYIFKCNDPNYNANGLNNFSYNLTSKKTYSLDQLIAEINNGFSIINDNFKNNFNTQNNFLNFNYNISSLNAYYNFTDSKFHIYIDINNIFTTRYFIIDISNENCILKKLFDISASSVSYIDLSDNSTLSGYGNNSTYSFDTSLVMVIYSNKKNCQDRGIDTNIKYRIFCPSITLNQNYQYIDLIDIIQSSIQNFEDVSNSTPLSESTFTIINNSTYFQPILNLRIQKTITQNEYTLYFYDSSFNNGSTAYDVSNSFWYKKLGLTTEYNIKKYQYPNTSYSDIYGNKIIDSDNIVIAQNDNNNIIELIPIDNGVIDAGTISLEIPYGSYNRGSLFIEINKLFTNNDITRGTKISYITDNDAEYTQIRWNLNKVYTSIDYKLVFYDVYDFVSCFIGNSSIRNATWDTTLGWIIGFHDLQEYPLTIPHLKNGYYYDISNSNSTNNEYSINTSIPYRTIVSLSGDTTVSINLYNYFMVILDDFNPSHLNDGLITITPVDNNLSLPAYANRAKYICDPVTKQVLNTGITDVASNNLTRNQIYSINQIINTQNTPKSNNNSGIYVSDIFGLIPIKTSGYTPGQLFVEYGGTLQAQDRIYFGPVNIHRMAISLLNDRGEIVDLNNANWSIQLICEQLYQNNIDVKT